MESWRFFDKGFLQKNVMDEAFRFFIYGYLNVRMIYIIHMKEGETLKSLKTKELISYLKIDGVPVIIRKVFLFLAKFLELPMSLLIESFYFSCYSIKFLFYEKQVSDGDYYHIGSDEPRFLKLLKNAHIDNKKVIVVKYPFMRYTKGIYKGSMTNCILNGLTYCDIVSSYLNSMRMSLFLNRRFGKTDVFFRSYSSFPYFLAFQFLNKLDSNKRIIYFDTYNRWAFLFGNLKQKTFFIQHGLIDKGLHFIKKVGSPTVGYFLSEEQSVNCCEYLFKNKPKTYILEGLRFTSDYLLNRNGKLNILIVCYHMYFEKEKEIITMLKEHDVNIYIKPHPLDDKSQYLGIGESFGVIVLDKTDFPCVNVVISYNSTLALEYSEAGVSVLRHDILSNKQILDEIILIKS